MILKRLELKNYRNYRRAEICPGAGVNILSGENGQGKTNLLEAVFMCCVGRSHRTRADDELIQFGQEVAAIRAEAEKRDGTHLFDIVLRQGAKKAIRINNSVISKMGEMMGHLAAVLFSPEDLLLIKEGPGRRRKFLDIALCQTIPSYFATLQQYNRALAQRNALLRAGTSRDSLYPWDLLLGTYGERIIMKRAELVAALAPVAREIHHNVSSGKEELSVVYSPSFRGNADELTAALQESAETDMRRKATCTGPHRDDISIIINGRDARAFASQGQQRTCALSLKLAELRIMEEAFGESPILLLDDVFSELDESRQKLLSEAMTGVQAIITCTGANDKTFASAKRFKVENGTIKVIKN